LNVGGGGGSGGETGANSGWIAPGGPGGAYGGGSPSTVYACNLSNGGVGAVRIIWAGASGITRAFPSTNTGNL
jgi:hypothetical protein